MHFRNVLFAVGLVALIAGATLAVLWIWQGGTGAAGPAEATAQRVAVLGAAADIRSGTLLRAEDMAWIDMPAEKVPPAAIHKAADAERAYIGAVTRRRFAAGEPIIPSGLVKTGERGFLAAVLSRGMRAVSIGVDASSSTAGLIQPGDYVDVLLAQTLGAGGSGGNAVSETVLQNVRVIAVDQWFAQAGRSVAGTVPIGTVDRRIPKTITLEVDEESAKRLLVAAQLGKVTLAMRPLVGAYAIPNRAAGDTEPVWASDVSAAVRGETASRQHVPAAAGPSAGRSIRIMRGSKTEVQ